MDLNVQAFRLVQAAVEAPSYTKVPSREVTKRGGLEGAPRTGRVAFQ
jgi:hypothetical protein